MSTPAVEVPTRRPRRLVLMGSGETTTGMNATHRGALADVGDGSCVVLDTPAGFQENVGDLAERISEYFALSLQRRVDIVRLRSAAEPAADIGAALGAVRSSAWCFAGPGSPSYAWKTWSETGAAELLRDVMRPNGRGGTVVLASAACCTAGTRTIPVYEIYKAGHAPHWLPGLDLTAAAGLDTVVIPHFDNTEGGNHDTRFCYVGERRLRVLEAELPATTSVLGIDEHTAVTIELDAATVKVSGLGGMTVRARARTERWASGTLLTLDDLRSAAADLLGPNNGGRSANESQSDSSAGSVGSAVAAAGSAAAALRGAEDRFAAALATRDLDAAAGELLALDDSGAGPGDSVGVRSARAAMIRALATVASAGIVPRAEIVAPFVDTLLRLRDSARAERRFADADAVRDVLIATGIEVRDTPNGVEWSIRT